AGQPRPRRGGSASEKILALCCTPALTRSVIMSDSLDAPPVGNGISPRHGAERAISLSPSLQFARAESPSIPEVHVLCPTCRSAARSIFLPIGSHALRL